MGTKLNVLDPLDLVAMVASRARQSNKQMDEGMHAYRAIHKGGWECRFPLSGIDDVIN
jgi:hypothetical protein